MLVNKPRLEIRNYLANLPFFPQKYHLEIFKRGCVCEGMNERRSHYMHPLPSSSQKSCAQGISLPIS